MRKQNPALRGCVVASLMAEVCGVSKVGKHCLSTYNIYICVGAVAPPGASQRRLSTLQPKGSARHGVRPCARHNSHSSKSIYDPSFQWPSWPKRRASFEPGYVTPNLEIPGLYWTAFKYARMSSIFEDLTPLLVTHVK